MHIHMDLLDMNESKRLQEKGIREQREHCYINYGAGSLSNSTAAIFNETTEKWFCPAYFDGIWCWSPTPANSSNIVPCPPYIAGHKIDANASRFCTELAEWFINPERRTYWTNYSQCIQDNPTVVDKICDENVTFPHYIQLINVISHTGYTISFCALLIAFVVMLAIKKLHCPRNKLHMHLFMSFILKIFFAHLKDILFVGGIGLKENIVSKNGDKYFFHDRETNNWTCKLVTTLWELFITANYSWILMEGLYLHNLIFRALFADSDRNILHYIILGWTLPTLVIIPWVITRRIYDDTFCWTTHNEEYIFLIIRIPTMISVLINFVLFIRITRVIYSKLQAPIYEEARRYQKWARSTLVLVPLFGIHYALFISISYLMDQHPITELIWIGCDQFFASFQGLFVAILYCFMNAEVRAEIKPFMHSFLTNWATKDYFRHLFPCRNKYLRSGRGRPSVCTTMSCSSLYNNGIGHHRNSKTKWESSLKGKHSGIQDKEKDHVCKHNTRSWHEASSKWLQGDNHSKESEFNRSSQTEMTDDRSMRLIVDNEKSKSVPNSINETACMLPRKD
ncbi:vasoactive intestinal polypeptide receptor 2-like isoform X1 [Onthophagus taurus]|uniref:vasoactive intestinal polypeptide receptor 2-like isoform X1 n=2 Tax=Onthophagus taurus TaxID=166361 RepID=UPI0039BE6185